MKLLRLHDTLETERCILKIPQETEAEYMWNLITEDTTKYMIWERWENYTSTLDNIKQAREKVEKWESWEAAIYDKKSWKLIGRCWINKTFPEIPAFELWYWVAEEYYGKGMVPECVARYLQFAFEESTFEKWVIRCDSENENSIKVALKCGFSFEGELKKDERVKWKLRDIKYFWITREDYFSKK